jgi:hypothetical protein
VSDACVQPLLKQVFAIAGLVLLIFSAFTVAMPHFLFRASAYSPVGSCFPSPSNVTISSPILWENLSCSHTGNVLFSGSGSFTLINSTLIQSGGVVNFSNFSTLKMQNSTLNLGFGSLVVTNNASAVVSESVIAGGTLSLANAAIFASGNSSSLDLNSLLSSGATRFELSSTTANIASGGIVNFFGYSISLTDSNFLASSLSRVVLEGSSSLSAVGSSIINQVGTSVPGSATLNVTGGATFLQNSLIEASGAAYFGYNVQASSNLLVGGLNSLQVSHSQILSGQSSQHGVYSSSLLKLVSDANISVSGSLLQSVSQNTSFVIAANSPPSIAHYIWLNQSTLEAQQSPGSLTLSATQEVALNGSTIDCNQTVMSVLTYQFWVTSTTIKSPDVSGPPRGLVTLINTTMPALSFRNFSSYAEYGILLVHVVNSSVSLSAAQGTPGAQVSVLDTSTSLLDYSGITNATGWVQIPTLLVSSNSTGFLNRTSYVVEASVGSKGSSQVLVSPTPSVYYATVVDPGTLYYPYSLSFVNGVTPVTQYIYFVSNAYPLDIFNNATYSQIDFKTVGLTGYTFSFTVIYPNSFTRVVPSVTVDGAKASVTSSQLNSTYSSIQFSMPSGTHAVALSYQAPPQNYYYNTSPTFTPGVGVIVGVVCLAVVGRFLLVLYVRKQEKKEVSSSASMREEE